MDQKRTTNAFVGRPLEWIEDLRLLKGRGQFVDDLAPMGAVNAVILRSSVAHSGIRSIDTAAAPARPGVLAVLTAADLGNAIIANYLMPTASDFPSIRAVALELEPSPNNPLGAKGAGEGGIIPVGGVIANAVANALGPLGVEPRELPLSPPRIGTSSSNRVMRDDDTP